MIKKTGYIISLIGCLFIFTQARAQVNVNMFVPEEVAAGKEFITVPGVDETCNCNECPYMKLNTLEKLYLCMRDRSPEIVLDEALRLRALQPIERMLALS